MKQVIGLTIDDKLIERMKLQAIRDKRSVSEITAELWREYLKRPKESKTT